MAILPIRHISQILPEVKKDPSHTLAMFDIGYTLIQPAGPMLGTREGRKYLLSQFPIAERKARNALTELATELAPLMQWALVEADVAGFIQRLQKEGISTLAITGAGNNFIFKWPYFPKNKALDQFQYYAAILKQLGIEMGKSCPQGEQLKEVCDYLSAKYQDGILFTCGQPMSNLLPHFLKATTKKYKRFIIVDDELDFLEQLAVSLKSEEIEFVGYHYLAPQPAPFNANIAEIQLRQFQNNHILLTDEEAAGLPALA